MSRLFIAGITLLLACSSILAAEPGDTPDAAQKPKESAPQEPAAPKKIEYDKLAYPALLKMAKANDAAAQFELGSRYNYGRDQPKNAFEALTWLRKAASAGQRDALRLLAVKLYTGYDMQVDLVEAFQWTERLANSGDHAGQLMLGNLYANGEGTARDLVRAYMWYDIAATPINGQEPDDQANQAMKDALDAREKTRDLLQPEQQVEAQRMASTWWQKKYAPELTKKIPAKKTANKKKAASSRKKKTAPKE